MIRISAALFCALIVFVPPAWAVTTYTYTGQSFTDFVKPNDGLPAEANYFRPGEMISGSITFAEALMANAETTVSWRQNPATGLYTSDMDPSFRRIQFNNGTRDFEATASFDSSPFAPPVYGGVALASLRLITGALGEILYWSIYLDTYENARTGPFHYAETINVPGGASDTGSRNGGQGYYSGSNTASPGVWTAVTVVPVPAGALLLATALGGLALLRRHRRHAGIAMPERQLAATR